MKYQIKTLEMSNKNPVEPVQIGPMAPYKPVLNKGTDEIAIYPVNGSPGEAVRIASKKWAMLPPQWVHVMVRPAEDTNAHLCCAYTVVADYSPVAEVENKSIASSNG